MEHYKADLIVIKFNVNHSNYCVSIKNRFNRSGLILDETQYAKLIHKCNGRYIANASNLTQLSTYKKHEADLINNGDIKVYESNVYRLLFDGELDIDDFNNRIGSIKHIDEMSLTDRYNAYVIAYRYSIDGNKFYIPLKLSLRERGNKTILLEDEFLKGCYDVLVRVFKKDNVEEEFKTLVKSQKILIEDIDPIEYILKGKINEDEFYTLKDELLINN